MPSMLDMPAMGQGFRVSSNTLLGQGATGNDRLGGTSSGLQRSTNFFSGGTDVVLALQQSLAANPSAGLLLTSGAMGGVSSPAGSIGVGPPSPSGANGAAGSQGRATTGTANR